MGIRSQLLLAFLLLAVLPLVGIVGFSYVNSQRAIGRAAAAEASQLSADMEEHMKSAREWLKARVAAVPWATVIAGLSEEEIAERVQAELGDVAPMLDALTFIPRPPPAEAPQAWPDEAGSGDLEPDSARPGSAPPGSGQPGAVQLGSVQTGAAVPAPEAPDQPMRPPLPPEVRIETRVLRLPIEEGVEEPSEVIVFEEHTGHCRTVGSRFDFQFEMSEDGEHRKIVLPPDAVDMQASQECGDSFVAWREAAEIDLAVVQEDLERELERHRRAIGEQRSSLVFGERALEVRQEGELIGSLRPQINPERLLAEIFRGTFAGKLQQGDEIPFAVDREGRLYAGRPGDRERLEELDVAAREAGESWRQDDWVIATSADEPTGLRLGVARPIGKALRELRSSALRNLTFGLALIALALLGILPVSGRLSRGVQQVAEGAERIARGDLETRLPVQGRGELAHLARAFNSMAHDVRDHQERLIAEERRQRDQQVERQVMQAELDRQRQELEEARAFQLSMLPRDLPEDALWESAVFVETATEVGGDYYDFRATEDGRLTAVVGDATGHGARAGTMVTVIKSLFSGHSPTDSSPSEFLAGANKTVRRMNLGRMAMAVTILSLGEKEVVLSNAGMPPLLHHSGGGGVREILVPGMPLGGLQASYDEKKFEVAAGDTLLLYSDGLPEQPGIDGEPVGYDIVKRCFESTAEGPIEGIIEALAATVEELTGGDAPQDDVTILVLRRR